MKAAAWSSCKAGERRRRQRQLDGDAAQNMTSTAAVTTTASCSACQRQAIKHGGETGGGRRGGRGCERGEASRWSR